MIATSMNPHKNESQAGKNYRTRGIFPAVQAPHFAPGPTSVPSAVMDNVAVMKKNIFIHMAECNTIDLLARFIRTPKFVGFS